MPWLLLKSTMNNRPASILIWVLKHFHSEHSIEEKFLNNRKLWDQQLHSRELGSSILV